MSFPFLLSLVPFSTNPAINLGIDMTIILTIIVIRIMVRISLLQFTRPVAAGAMNRI